MIVSVLKFQMILLCLERCNVVFSDSNIKVEGCRIWIMHIPVPRCRREQVSCQLLVALSRTASTRRKGSSKSRKDVGLMRLLLVFELDRVPRLLPRSVCLLVVEMIPAVWSARGLMVDNVSS